MTVSKQRSQISKPIKTLSWGDKIYLEVPIYKYRNQLIARYGETADGKKYIEFSKFGPLPNGATAKVKSSSTYSQKLRLYKPSHWGTIKHITESTLFPAIGWKKSDSQTDIELTVVQKLTRQVKNKSEELSDKQKIINELISNVALYRDQNLRNKVPEYKKTLGIFKKLVEDEKAEKEYQKFLMNNYWIFGLEYISVKSQKMGGASNRPDFSLERYDTFRDIVEIKRPQDKLFVKLRSNRFTQGPKLKEALAEVMDYIDYFLAHVNDEVIEYGEMYYKPKAIIVIGRIEGFKDKVRQLNSFLHRIEILTYDDLIERAQKIIDFYEK